MSTAPAPQRLLRHYLLRWTLGVVVVVWLVVVAQAWSTASREARKFSDGQMVAVAKLWLMAEPIPASARALDGVSGLEHEFLQDVAVVVWDAGRVLTDTHGVAAGIDPSKLPSPGFTTLQLQVPQLSSQWRAFSVQSGEGEAHRRVLVLTDMRQRYELGADIASHVAEPALLVLPLMLLLLWWTVRRGLRPLDHLSQEVASLDGFAGQRLGNQQRFGEFTSTVTAINGLVDTLQERAQRERAFASDVAHELRTPLAALALQSRAVQHDPSPERLAQLEQESLRAGRILNQLLDLARAQRQSGQMAGAPGEAVALGELAARLIAAHAQGAHDSGHELSLAQPDTAVVVRAQPLLLELALRNLIENALRHTPRGTQVVVQVWQTAEANGVSVSDDGRRANAVEPLPAESGGLGLGLRLVERIAEQIGGALVIDSGESPMTTRFTLRWARELRQV